MNPERSGIIAEKMTYSQRLIQHTYASQNEDACFLDFRLLQRMNLVQIEHESAQLKGDTGVKMGASDEEMKKLGVTLREYGKSLFSKPKNAHQS